MYLISHFGAFGKWREWMIAGSELKPVQAKVYFPLREPIAKVIRWNTDALGRNPRVSKKMVLQPRLAT